jgi:hypothetical protein
MPIMEYQTDMQCLLSRASEMLGAPARLVQANPDVQAVLGQHMVFEARKGLVVDQPMMFLRSGRPGCNVISGLERYRLDVNGTTIPLVVISVKNIPGFYEDILAVPTHQFVEFYRFVRRKLRRSEAIEVPVMPAEQRQKLWDLIIGFLKNDRATLEKYDVPQKRGVLLYGSPGNGKTMACRWLRHECRRHHLQWRSVSTEDYEQARSHGKAASLFKASVPSVILFDDFTPEMLADDRNVFLAGLDGLDCHHQVVYLFTSNDHLRRFDPAFRRPGRIDIVFEFPNPDAELRKVFVERWHADIRAAVNPDQVVADTADASFAELEQLRRLLVSRFLAEGTWDWAWARDAFLERREESRSVGRIGFIDRGRKNGQWQLRSDL